MADLTDENSRHLLVRAFQGETVERTPVWAMRQAGRWDPEFRKIRGNLGFYEFSENPELAAAASLCPRRFGVDGIILFYDITTLSVAMGQVFDLVPDRGPVPRRPIRTMKDVEALSPRPDPEKFSYVLETLRIVGAELNGTLPALVFAGAPFTLASYQIGTGKDLAKTRAFIRENPIVWRSLLERIGEATVHFLRVLLARGAAAYQLFDSWAGALNREEYLDFAQPYHQRVFEAVGGVSILFVKDTPYIDLAATSGVKVVSVGKMHKIDELKTAHPSLVFQGNVDHMLLVNGTQEEVQVASRKCLASGGGHRHVLNLDHGMDRLASPENFAAFVQSAINP